MNHLLKIFALVVIYQSVCLILVQSTQVSVSYSKVDHDKRLSSDLCKTEGLGFAYHNATKSCHMVGTQGPCADLMKFRHSANDSNFGECVCDFRKVCGRPVVHWPEDNKCYFINDQGPCKDNEWLTFTDNRSAICTENVCKQEQLQMPTNGSHFWFSENGTCYRTGSRGYCSSPDALLFFRNKDTGITSEGAVIERY